MQKKIKQLSIFFLILLVFGCSFLPKPAEKEILLWDNINKFRNFHLEGIASINYKQFVFRKTLVMDNSENMFSALLLGGGITGMGAAPFAKIEITDEVKIEIMGQKQKAPFTIEKFSELIDWKKLKKHSSEICKTGEYKIKNTIIYWSEQMQITKIENPEIICELNYDLNGNLDNLEISLKKEKVLEIAVDKIIYR